MLASQFISEEEYFPFFFQIEEYLTFILQLEEYFTTVNYIVNVFRSTHLPITSTNIFTKQCLFVARL